MKSKVVDHTGNGIGKISAPQTTLNGNKTVTQSVGKRSFPTHKDVGGLSGFK